MYKGREISKTMSGGKLIFFVRDEQGNIVFEAPSEAKLEKIIDQYIEDRRIKREEAERASEKNKKKRKEQSTPPEETNLTAENEEKVIEEEAPDQTTPLRGPDGKFLSTKKSFWNR